MTGLQAPGRQNSPEPFSDLVAKIRSMQGELGDVTSSVLRSAGIAVATALTTFDRVVKVVGGLIVEGPSTLSGAVDISGDLDVTGDAAFSGTTTIGGNASITGTLSLPAGIIDNDALANPVEADSENLSTSGMTFTGSMVEYATKTFIVPAGFTKAIIFGAGNGGLVNGSGSTVYLFTQTFAWSPTTGTSAWGAISQSVIPAGTQGTVSSNLATVLTLTGAPGQTIDVYAKAAVTGGAPAGDPGNFVGVGAVVMYTR